MLNNFLIADRATPCRQLISRQGCIIIQQHLLTISSKTNLANTVQVDTIGPYGVLCKTLLKEDANFPYKRHILSKIRRNLAKTRLILEQPLTPVLR